jgi:DNA-binding beta-propeller fold protein YncE
VATVKFGDSAGLEACGYDPVLDTFYVNNDGITTAGSANAHGELERLPGAAIRAIPAGGIVDYSTLTGLGRTSEGNCDPTGLALGPGTDLAVGCREGTTGAPLNFLIFNRSTGALLTTLNAGGGDQIWYDPTSNAYYNAASRWTASGLAATNGACSAASPCSPELIVVDAATRKVAGFAPVGNNAHSVAVDPVTGLIFVPYSSAAAPAGCGTCSDFGFINGGISVFKVSQFFH